jgi:maltose alpha-D-glucosyltransferase/alpha-amylase
MQANKNLVHKTPAWLESAVFYQIYPQSFQDTNNDGIGDIKGIIRRLNYLQSLGINAIWLNPCFVSPFQDAGYDVADYYKVAPRYGTNADLISLCKKAHEHDIKVFLDLVPGHTSIEHPWFKMSGQHRRNKYSDRFIWTSELFDRGDGTLNFIQGYAPRNGNYATNFFYCQPALNYGFARPDPQKTWQQPVNAPGPVANRRELIKIMSYWLDRGVDGFRVDMAFSLVKNDPTHHETIKLWRDIFREIRPLYPEAVFISEWGNPEEAITGGFDIDFLLHFGAGGYADLMLNEKSFFRRRGGITINSFLQFYLKQAAAVKGKGLISVPSSSHDIKRLGSDERTTRDLKVIFTFLLTWPGIPLIYYGDEIGMRFIKGLPSKEGGYMRTGTRTPMQWDDGRNAGFSTAERNLLYLPVDPRRNRPTVQSQENDPELLLTHVKKLIALRKSHRALQATGSLEPVYAPKNRGQFAYIREYKNERFLIVLNPSALPFKISLKGIKTDNKSLMLGYGVSASVAAWGCVIKLSGVSYGIFQL